MSLEVTTGRAGSWPVVVKKGDGRADELAAEKCTTKDRILVWDKDRHGESKALVYLGEVGTGLH
jgi:hypothetical protein